jgi:3-hydroxyacyl-CoA dehydrogenase
MSYVINRVVVIGSGTMGGGIAAHVANAGLPVYLLDLVTPSLDRLKKSRPPSFFTPQTADLVSVGNLTNNFSWVAEGDWIVEAIVENLQAKRELVARIEQVRKPASRNHF